MKHDSIDHVMQNSSLLLQCQNGESWFAHASPSPSPYDACEWRRDRGQVQSHTQCHEHQSDRTADQKQLRTRIQRRGLART